MVDSVNFFAQPVPQFVYQPQQVDKQVPGIQTGQPTSGGQAIDPMARAAVALTEKSGTKPLDASTINPPGAGTSFVPTGALGDDALFAGKGRLGGGLNFIA